MSIISKAFEFFFPIPPAESHEDVKEVTIEDIKGKDNTLLGKAESAKRCYEEERSRTRAIEGKASMFITSTGILGTVLIGTSTLLLRQPSLDLPYSILMIVSLLLFVIYMVLTILFSLKALTRRMYSRPDPFSLLGFDKEDELRKNTIVDFINATIFNQVVTNRKVEFVVAAQEHYKRAMIFVLIYVLVLLLYVLQLNGVSVTSWFHSVNEEIATWSLQTWFIVIISVLSVSSLTIGIIALANIRTIKKKR